MGIAKASQETVPLVVLAVLAGAFIAVGAMYFNIVSTQTGMGLGPSRVMRGVAFSLG